ncbi:Gfo/Idh/MocA family protein [Enterococcus sp. AD013-P3]|uniref:Gfo/Idh/MocA family protein n=1 Tax=Enterococcus sp. AD013-P3 TaxID=3411036 RepID=UPI003B94AA82
MRLVIIGYGNMGQRYVNELMEEPLENVRIYGVQTGNSQKAANIIGKWPELKVFVTFQGVLQDPLVEGVLIATPNRFHFAMAKEALLKNKHVLVEKPAAISEDEIMELTNLSESCGLICEVMFQSRFDPLVKRMKELSGTLGRLQRFQWNNPQYYRDAAYFLEGSWSGTWVQDGGGILLNQAVHQIDLLDFLFGSPNELVSSISFGKYRNIEVDDEAFLILRYPNGLTGTFMTSFAEPLGKESVELVGENGRLEVVGNRLTCQLISGETFTETFDEPKQWEKNRHELIRNFELAARGSQQSQVPVAVNLRALMLIHGAWLSSWQRKWIHLPLQNEEYCEGFRQYMKEDSNK